MSKELKIVFAPGALDDFDGTQEELDALMDEITAAFESGELLENAVPIEEDDEIWDLLQERDRTRQ